ncbi:MAG: hypothetical protein LBD23_10065 [Oscillospiraceae bacterium]|nr:hypothetical protein [Oscillospiraceae bacterium]
MKTTAYSGREFKSGAVFSLHGMIIKDKLFAESWYHRSTNEDWQLKFPFPVIMVIDICGKNDVEPTTSREKIINDEKWLQFRRNLFFEICRKIREKITQPKWEMLKKVLLANAQDDVCKDVLNAF